MRQLSFRRGACVLSFDALASARRYGCAALRRRRRLHRAAARRRADHGHGWIDRLPRHAGDVHGSMRRRAEQQRELRRVRSLVRGGLRMRCRRMRVELHRDAARMRLRVREPGRRPRSLRQLRQRVLRIDGLQHGRVRHELRLALALRACRRASVLRRRADGSRELRQLRPRVPDGRVVRRRQLRDRVPRDGASVRLFVRRLRIRSRQLRRVRHRVQRRRGVLDGSLPDVVRRRPHELSRHVSRSDHEPRRLRHLRSRVRRRQRLFRGHVSDVLRRGAARLRRRVP